MPRPLAERFFNRIAITESGCWQWTGAKKAWGYGDFVVSDRRPLVAKRIRVVPHRWSYEWFNGPIPEGLQIDHLCRNRLCVNPDHLEAVTQRENILRGIGLPAQNHVKTHCLRGHEFTPENTFVKKQRSQFRR